MKANIRWEKIYHGLEYLLSVPKSFYASWRLTSFRQAYHLPILCRFNCKLLNVSGIIKGGGKLRIGFNRTGLYDAKYQRAILNIAGVIEMKGNLNLGAGSRLEVGRDGILVIGGNVANSAGATICCHDKIEIGGGTVISWDTLIIDKDFHYIIDVNTSETRQDHKPITIGGRVWLCVGCKVLKGSVLPDGCILAAGAVLNRPFEEENCLLMGNPSVIVKHGVRRSDRP